MAQIVFLKEGKPVIQKAIEESPLLIGRDPDCDIQLMETEISRKHCVIEKRNGHFILKDFSRNGTFVNRKRFHEKKIDPKDEIRIGPWVLKLVAGTSVPATDTRITETKEERQKNALGSMTGNSKAMKEVFRLLCKAAPSDIPVCLMGESGTGKELAAKLIHDLSPRREKPFVAINCGAIPASLIESLLFGHEKGSFTGAFEKQEGVFEQADEGTLFLDEIGEMPLDLQTRLLRVMENQVVRRIGGKADIQVSVRFITATLRDLKRETEEKKFREDLFYRLYIFPIRLPPLRERGEDVAALAKHFLKMFTPEGRTVSLAESAKEKLQRHSWPGNVRELKNALQRSLLLSRKDILEAKDIELARIQSGPPPIGEVRLTDQERLSVIEALRKSKGNYSQAARTLGIARSTLDSKLRKYKLEEADWI